MTSPGHSEATKGPCEFTTFTRSDGKPIETDIDVAITTAQSAIGGAGYLYGVTLPGEGPDGLPVVICYTGKGPASEEWARKIVLAVNAYEDMLAALEMFVSRGHRISCVELRITSNDRAECHCGYRAARAAIAKAKGEGNG